MGKETNMNSRLIQSLALLSMGAIGRFATVNHPSIITQDPEPVKPEVPLLTDLDLQCIKEAKERQERKALKRKLRT